MINKKLFNKRAGISYLQIVLLIAASFAFSYIVYESSAVSAISAPSVCCEKTKTGAACQDTPNEDSCDLSFMVAPNLCEETSYCKLGCCIDDEQGIYDKNVPKSLCQARWVDDKNCNVPGSELGCCILNENNILTTQRQCELFTQQAQGLSSSADWRKDFGEAECVLLSTSKEKGACVIETQGQRNCKHATQEECLSLTGSVQNFYQGYLCSAEQLNTLCEKTEETTCAEGRDEVYFVDSCGNIANIYDSSKINNENYWSKIVSKEDSCNSNSGNADSKSCGNCQRFLGGICSSAKENKFKPTYGDYFCKQTSCTYKGKTYQNAESWCVYDGKIGDGDDVVGSRHWRYVCNQGEIQVEPCSDYRNQLCVQKIENTNRGGFSTAVCRVNDWRKCIDLNSGGIKIEECEKNEDCFVKSVNFGKSFNFNVCVPKYPEGFDLSGRESRGSENICSFATRTCVIRYESHHGDCECVENCGCEDASFATEMNDLCISLGDCGGYVNIEGKPGSGGFSGVGLDVNQYSGRAIPIEGQYAKVGDLREYLEKAGILGFNDKPGAKEEEEEEGSWNLGTKIGAGAGGIGLAISTYSWYGSTVEGTKLGLMAAAKQGAISGANIGAGGVPAWIGGFANFAMSIGIIVGASSIIVSLLGHQTSTTGYIAGALAGASAWFVASTLFTMAMAKKDIIIGFLEAAKIFSGGGASLALGPAGVALAVGIAVAVGIMLLFSKDGLFAEECENKQVTFVCDVWQPPVGGADCEKCNNNPLKPCSEYRCQSLGTACRLVNKGTGNEKCYDDNPNDVTPPTIEPQYGIISENEKYSDISDKGFRITNLQGGCLDAYTPLLFGITTNELAKCKFDLQEKSFEEMVFNFGGFYSKNHTTTFTLPDPSHGQSQGIDWTGDLTLYIKCQDTHGNEIPGYYTVDTCVYQGPDRTPPVITAVLPPNDAYVSFNKTEQEVFIFTNEVSECRWNSEDKTYEEMENSFDCVDDIKDLNIFGYSCNATLPTTNTENVFYIKCKDQPWLENAGRGEERNANQESFVYLLKKVETQIKIDSVFPSGRIEISSAPATVILKVQTSGGGKFHSCSYSFFGYENMIDFWHTNSNSHEQEFILNPGAHKIYVKCKDETGDSAEQEVNFKLIYDSSPPLIARVYVKDNKLNLITTESADCAYSTESCDYGFSEGNSMGSGKEHSISYKRGKKYYVKCKDALGNAPGSNSCSIVIMPV